MRRETSDIQTKITLSPRAEAQVEKSFIERTIAEAWEEVEGHLPCYEGRAEFAVDALSEAGFIIVRKPQPGSTAADRVEFARRTGCWDGVSDRDYTDWVRSLVPGAFVIRTVEEMTTENKKAWFASVEALYRDKGVPTGRVLEVVYAKPDGTTETVRHAEFMRQGGLSFDPPSVVGMRALEVRVPGATETVALQPGNVFELPPGTQIRSADAAAPEPERDNLGLCLRSADDFAAGYDCRVQLVGVDDARFPLSVEDDEGDYVVVTDRHSGRVVGLVEAWHGDDGDPIVPKAWLEIVLSAWDAAKEPQWAA